MHIYMKSTNCIKKSSSVNESIKQLKQKTTKNKIMGENKIMSIKTIEKINS